jgi:ABC-2 type transport system ATP-binding protein
MVSIKNLCFSYKPKHRLFNDLNLELMKGHIYGLLGKNGAGKSTLLKNIVGLAFPEAGICTVNGRNVSGRPVSVLQDLFFIPEELYVPTVTPDVYVSRTSRFYPKFDKVQYAEYLNVLDVDPTSALDKLSFGQQKKAMIAFGLATNTSLLIMDEPTNGLDIPSKVQFRKLIASVLTDNRCIVISTHQVRDLDSLIDTVVVLNNREIALNLSIDELTEQVVFGTYTDTAGLPVLYEEEAMRGKNAILKNTGNLYSKVDLELLFNAITGNNPLLLNHFKNPA